MKNEKYLFIGLFGVLPVVEFFLKLSERTVSTTMLSSIPIKTDDIVYSKLIKCEPGEEITITGISGVYPKADNIRELGDKLWSKEDLVSEILCKEEDGLSPSSRYGKINEERIRKFDASFFKISTWVANGTDPQARILLELTYEAIMDAGYNPEHFRGTKTGVFVSVYRSDSTESWIYEKNASEGAGFYGNTRSMMASRISFALGLTGPAIAVDSACSSSLSALDFAVKNIRSGICDAAIVAGCNLLLHWQTIRKWHEIGLASTVGKCQTFSETADGYCRSEALVVLLIQKKKDARRLYAEVIHVKMNNTGDRAAAVEKTSDTSQIELLKEFYSECRIDPTTLHFVELHGVGTKVGDLMESVALEKFFLQPARKTPLKVGSIKSNMGHSEAVSGLCAISKAVLMFEREMIPPNLHFYEPRSEITSLHDGRMQVVTELQPFPHDLIAITNLGYGGSNGHTLLRHNIKRKFNNSKPTDYLPRLVVASGRTEMAVRKIFDELVGKPLDSEFVRLLHAIFADNIPDHCYRGYVLLNTDGIQIDKQIEKFGGDKRPVWFIFRGMGSQYPTMGRSLLQVPVMRKSIEKSHQILKKKDIDLIEIITEDNASIFDNILHSFVGIAAIQIALIDLLRTIGINPDGMIGHSVGELGCAYADNCLTAEQTILAAYYRGKVSNDTNLVPGYMASVGMPLNELKSLLPPDIDIACHNASNNYTISGPQDSVNKFCALLEKEGIFVKNINVSNVAYHSRYIQPAVPKLLSEMKMYDSEYGDTNLPKWRHSKPLSWDTQLCDSIMTNANVQRYVTLLPTFPIVPTGDYYLHLFLRHVISENSELRLHFGLPFASWSSNTRSPTSSSKIVPEHILRSEKWISSSVPEADWGLYEAKYSCAEYYVNNLKNYVNFEESCRHIPNNAITIEISPHGFFQSLIERLPDYQLTNVPLLSRDSQSGCDFLLSALGRIYNLGVNCKIGLHTLYPSVSFPVSKGTPMISPLIEWNHDNDYFVTKHFLEVKKSAEQVVVVSLNNPEWEFLRGHIVDGKILFPGVGYLYLVWRIFSKIQSVDYTENSIVVENLQFKKAVILTTEDEVEFTVSIQKGCGTFEIIESDTVVALGSIRKLEEGEVTKADFQIIDTDHINKIQLSSEDIYKELRIRGYQYEGPFNAITRATYDGSISYVKWDNNYVTFLDAVLQTFLLNIDYRQLLLPIRIAKIALNTELHKEFLTQQNTKYPEFIVRHENHLSVSKSVGIEIEGISYYKLRRKPLSEPVTLQKIEFLPFISTENYNLNEALAAISEIIRRNVHDAGNVIRINIRTLELVDGVDPNLPLISPTFVQILETSYRTQIEAMVMIDSNDWKQHIQLTDKSNIKIIKERKLASRERFTLVIASNLSDQNGALQLCLDALDDGGFLLLRRANEAITDEHLLNEFDICLDYKLENERIRLCRRRKKIDGNIRAVCISRNNFDWIQTVRVALEEVIGYEDKRLILFSENDEFSGIVGLSNSLFREYGTQNIRCYLIDDKMAPPFSLHDPFFKQQISKDLLVNIYRFGVWGTFCDISLDKNIKIKVPHAELQLDICGDLSSLSLVEGPLDPSSFDASTDKALLHIYYSEMNFRDVLLASGKLPSVVLSANDSFEETKLGFGCSGKTDDGKRYMTVAKSGCFATLLSQDTNLLIPVPDHWTLEEAASVPIAYLTVIYSFFNRQHLNRNDSVLIHCGTGGVGQAAIHICLYYGCTVFTTVGTEEKRGFIKKTFPSIPESHIGYSRDTSFEKMIKRETNGRGVDVVLNSLSGRNLIASIRCLAVGGRFIEIGLIDFIDNNPLYMGCFLKEISFHAIQLLNFFEATASEKKHLINLVVEHCNNGAIKPLNRTVFDLEDAESAFRYMGSEKHIGKVLLRIRQEESNPYTTSKKLSLLAKPKFFGSDNKSYIICGGLGGLGLELIDWLIHRGVKNIVISSRRGITTGYQDWKVQKWKSDGANIIIFTEDITKEQCIRNLLKVANCLGPVVAIFNLAMVLEDALFENQTEESFTKCVEPKINPTIHLDRVSREMCPYLEYFVVFSSATSGLGNLGQTNYGMANSAIERICEKRKAENLPGLAIQWGAIDDVGAFVENRNEKTLNIDGLIKQPIRSFLHEMNFLLKQPNTVVRSVIFDKMQPCKKEERTIFSVIERIFGFKEMEKLDPQTKLTEYGMDSITAIEVKLILEREFDIIVSLKNIKEVTIGRLIQMQNTKMNGLTDVAPLKTKPKAFMKFVRHTFEILKNSPANIKIEEWDLIEPEKFEETNRHKNCSNVFIFPGIEGNSKYLKNAMIHTNVRLYSIQYGCETVKDFQQIVQKLANRISSVLTTKENNTFIAYSFGCVVAVEVLKILGSQNRVSRLFLIDINLIMNSWIMPNSTDDMMNAVISQFLTVFWPEHNKLMLDNMRNLPDWNSKVKLVISQIPADLKYTSEQLTYSLNLIYRRLKIIKEWKFITKQPLTTSTTVMRPTVNLLEGSIQYDISQHFSSPVAIQYVEGNHFTMLKNINASNFGNISK